MVLKLEPWSKTMPVGTAQLLVEFAKAPAANGSVP